MMFRYLKSKFTGTHIGTQLFIILIFLNLLDFQTTKVLVDAQGFHVEANPLLRHLMMISGTVYSILMVKLVAMAFFSIWYCKADDTTKSKFVPILALGNVLFGIVCGLNLYYVFLIQGFIS